MFKGKRVFVSGGAGVIGNVLVKKLFDAGAEVFVGDLKPFPEGWPGEIRYRQGDLNTITEDELISFDPQYYFHLAATFERSVESYEFFEENYFHNIRLSHHLINFLKNCPALEKVIFASSYLIYDKSLYCSDEPAEKPVRLAEHDRINPRNLCGVAKLLHEIELSFLASFPETGFETVSARIFRSYGKESRDVISRWIRDGFHNVPISVFREEGFFDYIYAGDVAEGLLRMAAPGVTGVVNLGNDHARQVREVVKVINEQFPDLGVEYIDSDIPYEASQANMDHCNELINWAPANQVEDVIPLLVEYESERRDADILETQPINIMVTSVSKKIPLLRVLKESLNTLTDRGQITGCDMDEHCIGRYFTDAFWKMPAISELDTGELVSYCRNHKINIIIPTRDGELQYFADSREYLQESGIHVMVSSPEAVGTCDDKLAFFHKLESFNDIHVIPTFTDINGVAGELYVVKERYGAGARNIALNVIRDDALEHASKMNSPVFQPFIQGREYSVDIYITGNGTPKGVVARLRDVVINGESQVTTTVRNDRLENACISAAAIIGLTGHVIFQVIEDSNNNFHLVECNCRFGGASTLSVAAGLDSFYWFILESQGVDITSYPFHRSSNEIRQVRYCEDRISNDPGV